jgi:hypothetical protein
VESGGEADGIVGGEEALLPERVEVERPAVVPILCRKIKVRTDRFVITQFDDLFCKTIELSMWFF